MTNACTQLETLFINDKTNSLTKQHRIIV